VNVHPETGLLMVRGPETFLETVESIVTAWHANQRPEPIAGAKK
jgi:hypothetical protein